MSKQRKPPVSFQELWAGIAVLFVLTIIASGVFLRQFTFNPAIFPMKSAIGGMQGENEADLASLVSPIPEVRPLTPPERFSPETLSDKIDGKAELYLSSGFEEMESQRYALTDQREEWLELFIYDMGDVRNAFSVFSAQRREDAETTHLTPNAYRTKNALFFTHGPFYVEIIAGDVSREMADATGAIAQAFVKDTPLEERESEEASVIADTDLFPEEGLVDNSISLLSANVFGYDELEDIYVATYELDGKMATAFLSRRESPEAAEELAAGYADFLLRFGGEKKERELAAAHGDIQLIEIMGMYELIFTHNAFLAGVHEASSGADAERLGEMLRSRIAELF